MLESIKKIGSPFSVAGYEGELTEYIKNELTPYFTDCFVDNVGNLICHEKGVGDKILVNIPISSDGFFITHITDKGALKFSTIGKVKETDILGAKVINEKGELTGVVASEKEELSIDDMFIDGGKSTSVKVGDILKAYSEPYKIGDRLYGKDIGKNAVIYAVIETVKTLKAKGDIWFSFSVMDNLGFKGAKTSATLINPDICYTLSIADCLNKNTEIALSKGPAIRVKDSHIIVSKKLRDKLIKDMENENIPYQLEIVTGDGLTNNEIMYLSNGILTANINLPVRYKNTLNECVCEEDIINLIKTLKLILV